MAIETAVLVLSFPADEDLSSYQYHCVVLTATGVKLVDAITDKILGILQNAPKSGEEAVVMLEGISKAVANAALSAGDLVGPEFVGAADAGKVKAAESTNVGPIGMVVVASGAEDDLCSVWLRPMHKVLAEDLP